MKIINTYEFSLITASLNHFYNDKVILQFDRPSFLVGSDRVWILTDYKKGYFQVQIKDIKFSKKVDIKKAIK